MKYYLYILFMLSTMISCHTYQPITYQDVRDDLETNWDDLGKLLWHRSKNDIIVIHKKNLRKICRKSNSGYDEYFNSLDGYILFLTSEKNPIAKNLTFSERAKVAGYVIEYLYRCQQKFKNDDPYKDSKFIFRVLAFRDNNLYDREFKKHDYYGLPLLKQEHLKYFKYMPELDEDPNKPIKNYTIE